MSSRTGSFAGFFPTAPSVQQQKRKRGVPTQQRADALSTASLDASPGAFGLRHASPSHGADHISKRESLEDSVNTTINNEEKIASNGETGDPLNGVGSAGSLSTTVSSVFSNAGVNGVSNHNGTINPPSSFTPLTNHESSPPQRMSSPSHLKFQHEPNNVSSESVSHREMSSHHISFRPTAITPNVTPPHDMVSARPVSGLVKGERAVFDPELDQKLTSKEKKKLKPRYRTFGETESAPPPDPRLALPGYKSGDFAIRLKDDAKVWKQKRRPAPYIVPPYPWDSKISIGLGPPTGVVVTGFDPLVPEAQIRALFGSFGDILTLEKQMDPNTGSFLSVCAIRYKDGSRARGTLINAVDAARRAEKNGSGQRVGLHAVRAERDRTGKRCKRYVDSLARKRQEERNKAMAAERKRESAPLPPPPPPPPHIAATTTETSSEFVPAPPINAPKGPSAKSHHWRAPNPATVVPRPTTVGHRGQEPQPILPTLKRKPYIFISADSVPSIGTTITHLQRRLQAYEWKQVRCDQAGYYIVFEDSRRGEDEARRCHKHCNMMPLFNYTMVMECQEYGNPNYERSPSPERAAQQKREREEQERLKREEEFDVALEKKQRAENLDPVLAALEIFKNEVRDKVMSDVKARIAVPTLYDHLDPTKHRAKRQKLGLSEPSEPNQPIPLLAMGNDSPSTSSTPSHQRSLGGFFKRSIHANSISIFRKDREDSRQSHTDNVFVDERRQARPAKRKIAARPLHHRLHDFYNQEESDGEEKRSSREDTKDRESASFSRATSIAPSTVVDDEASRKQNRVERQQTPQGEESGEDNWGVAKSILDPHLLKKDPEDMAMRELQQVISTLPLRSRMRQAAKRELDIRMRNQNDDQLFKMQSERSKESDVGGTRTDEATLPDAPATADALSKVSKKKPKAKKKSKKQLFEEREAAKLAKQSAKALLQAAEASTPEALPSEDLEADKASEVFAEDPEEEDEPPPEVEWGVSADVPRRTVQDDDEDFVLDIDGWQHLVKDDEDLTYLKEVSSKLLPAGVTNARAWAFSQKQIKYLNNGNIAGLTRDQLCIKGYYVPNHTGSARSEGIQKILESEKSKYLPHRIKVARARERREAEAEKGDLLAKAEANRKAKIISNATSRSNRANNRTQIKDLNVVKQSLAADGQQSDSIRFNQLKKRKKLVKFDRSAIHGWGLYAEENIAMSDMIIEYVGEKVRQAVANIREIRYDKQGMGSSYLFRIDEDTVVDATKKGGIARFINHSCEPNCTAKIIKVDGTKRIVIYALKEIGKNQELTYDYKFDREMDSTDRVPCLCGSANCKKFLN